MKVKLKKINKILRHGGLEVAVNYVPSGKKDTFLTVNWIGDQIVKEYLAGKLEEVAQVAISNVAAFINDRL